MSSSSVLPRLIVGLGNPEPRYDRTRHNIGFAAIDELASAWYWTGQEQRRFRGWLAEGPLPKGAGKGFLLKPTTYMNSSGQSVRAVLDWYKLEPERVLVIYDDMDLPPGRIRLRLKGSAGGHNGIKSLISHLGTQAFPRLRIGIGRTQPGKETVSFVLGKFSPAETEIMKKVIPAVTQAVELGIHEGVEVAMNRYNPMVIGQ
ncbi:MAG: aminoacyl-tRNA hydrolase [Cyanobacteria bacterium P01_H01_bin.15]